MNPISAAAVYFIIWWVTLFAVLPLGLKTQEEAGEVVPGTHASAPSKPRIGLVAGVTTLLATAIFAAFYWFAVVKGLRFDDFAAYLPTFMSPPSNQ